MPEGIKAGCLGRLPCDPLGYVGATSWRACRYVAERHPKADPNGWVLRLADIVLGLGSELGLSLYLNASHCFAHGVKWRNPGDGTDHEVHLGEVVQA
jgi:hypothetical protein